MTDDVLATYDGALRAAHTRIAELERERDEAARLAERYMAGWQPDLNEALRERDELKATLDRMRLTDRMLAGQDDEALEYGIAAPVAFDKMQALTRRAERAEAACAQMRAALEDIHAHLVGLKWPPTRNEVLTPVEDVIAAALEGRDARDADPAVAPQADVRAAVAKAEDSDG